MLLGGSMQEERFTPKEREKAILASKDYVNIYDAMREGAIEAVQGFIFQDSCNIDKNKIFEILNFRSLVNRFEMLKILFESKAIEIKDFTNSDKTHIKKPDHPFFGIMRYDLDSVKYLLQFESLKQKVQQEFINHLLNPKGNYNFKLEIAIYLDTLMLSQKGQQCHFVFEGLKRTLISLDNRVFDKFLEIADIDILNLNPAHENQMLLNSLLLSWKNSNWTHPAYQNKNAKKRETIIKKLVEDGADPRNITDEFMRTMISSTSEIHKFLTQKREKSLEVPLDRSHNENYTQPKGAKKMKELKRNILIKDQKEITKILTENPEIINTTLDEKGYSALHFTVASLGKGGFDIIRLLLRNGANPHNKDKDGKKPVDLLHKDDYIKSYLEDVMKYPYKIFEDDKKLEKVPVLEVPNGDMTIQSPSDNLPAETARTELELAQQGQGGFRELPESEQEDPSTWHDDLANKVFAKIKQMKVNFIRKWSSNETAEEKFCANLSSALNDLKVFEIFLDKLGEERLIGVLADKFKFILREGYFSIYLEKRAIARSVASIKMHLLSLANEFKEVQEEVIGRAIANHTDLPKIELEEEVKNDFCVSFGRRAKLPQAPKGETDYYHPLLPLHVACIRGDIVTIKALLRNYNEDLYCSNGIYNFNGVKYPADLFIEGRIAEGKLDNPVNVEFLRYLHKLHAYMSQDNNKKLQEAGLWERMQQEEEHEFTLKKVKDWSPRELVEVDEFGSTKLHQVIAGTFATAEEKIAAVNYLLTRSEVSIDVLDRCNDTALTIAIREKEPEIAIILMDADCTVKQGLIYGSDSPLLLAIKNSKGEDREIYLKIIDRIIESRKGRISDIDSEGIGPIEYAILNEDVELALYLFKDHKVGTIFGVNSLIAEKFAEDYHVREDLAYFLEHPIKYAIFVGKIDLVSELMVIYIHFKYYSGEIEHNALINFTKEKCGEDSEIYYMIKYPMHYAVEHSNMELLNRLFHYDYGNPELRDEKCELDVDATQKAKGKTPVEMALEYQDKEFYGKYFGKFDHNWLEEQKIAKELRQQQREKEDQREKLFIQNLFEKGSSLEELRKEARAIYLGESEEYLDVL